MGLVLRLVHHIDIDAVQACPPCQLLDYDYVHLTTLLLPLQPSVQNQK